MPGHEGILFGGSLAAALVAGAIALLAPCCISVMLPAYFAGSFQNRGRLVAMTFVFAAGIATVILPIALGAATLLRLINGGHTPIYVAGGLLMLALGGYVLAGGKLRLPVPGGRARGGNGPLAVYSLGVFSGVASSCCAPVLAGLVTLSGLSASLPVALGLGSAYVLGMVAPLFVMSLLWDAVDWRSSRLFRPRTFRWRLGPVSRTLSLTDLLSGMLLGVMGAGAVWIGLSGNPMPVSAGWQARLTVVLQSYGHAVTEVLSALPAWLVAIVLVALVVALGRLALVQVGVLGRRRVAKRELPSEVEGGKVGQTQNP